MKNTIKMYNGKVYGKQVSDYGIENGYLDYHTLEKILGGVILNNSLIENTDYEDWEIENELDSTKEIYQFYIISEYGRDFLVDYTDELVYYNEKLDIYLWGITHFGTSWDYVLTDIKLEELV